MDIPQTVDQDTLIEAEEEVERLSGILKEKLEVELEDIGTLRRRMRVRVPAEVIDGEFRHNFDKLRHDVVLPGFRKGRAPLALVQKRYGPEVRESLKSSLIAQAWHTAVEREGLEVVGEPLFRIDVDGAVRLMDFEEALGHIELKEGRDLSFECELEVKPQFELPDLENIEITLPAIEITDAMIDEQIERQCKVRGRIEPINEPADDPEDIIIADVRLLVDDQEIKSEQNVELGLRPTRLDGIPLENLPEVLKGVQSGQTRTCECTIPDDYERADLRGKPGTFEFTVHEIKRLVPISPQELAEQMGAESLEELRDWIREDMRYERDRMLRKAKKDAVCDWLIEHTTLDVPEQLSARLTDRAVTRKVIELQQVGVPMTEIEATIDQLRTTARDEAIRELKLDFILEKVAEKLDVSVTDEEVNSEIARIAELYNRRFDRVRDDLQARGLLPRLAETIFQEKCLALLAEKARVREPRKDDSAGKKGKSRASSSKKKSKAAKSEKTGSTDEAGSPKK